MTKFPAAPLRRPVRAASVLLASLLLAAGLAACAASPAGRSLPVNGLTLLDDYILVHGMAEGAMFSPGAAPTAVTTVAKLDLEAQMALRRSEEAPGSTSARDQARAAIERLSDYAARMNLQGAPAVVVGGGQS